MSQLLPLSFEQVESKTIHSTSSPFPVLDAMPAVAGAEMNMTDSAEAKRLQQLEKMLQDAQGRAENVEREAYDKAYAAGEKAGLALGEKRAEQVLEAMEGCLKKAESEAALMRQCCVDAVVDIAKTVAEQLVGNVVDEQEKALLHAAERAAEQLPEITQLKVAVNPDELESFARILKDRQPNWRLCADPAVAVGTCRIVTDDQDTFIDPVRAIVDSINRIPVILHSGSVGSNMADKDYTAPDPS